MALKILSFSKVPQQLIILLCLLTVFIGFFVIGWFMYGFAASQMVWIVTLAMGCYLSWVGTGGIALVSVWVVGLMSMAAIHHRWLRDLPRPEFQFIPMVLLANWLFALAVVWQLGKISDLLQQRYRSKMWVSWALIGVMVAGLVFGWQLYPQTLLFFSSSF